MRWTIARPRPLPLAKRAVERLEEPVELLGRDADALVLHRQRRRRPTSGSTRAARRRRPPSGIARRPLVARFQTICLIWPSSASYQSSRRPARRRRSTWSVLHLGAVAQQQRRVVAARGARRTARSRTAAAARRPGTMRIVVFSRSDSRSTMSISCACSRAERQLLPQDLDRARHRRQRVADLVGDAGRHLADRRQPLLQPRVALELLDRR